MLIAFVVVAIIVITFEEFGFLFLLHCLRNILNLRTETEPVTAGADATDYVRLLLTSLYLAQKLNTKYRCICFRCDRSGFNSMLRLFLGLCTVCSG